MQFFTGRVPFMPPIANSVKAPKAMFLPEVTVYCLLHGFFDFRYTYVYSLVVRLKDLLAAAVRRRR